jgi:hypothetical protein
MDASAPSRLTARATYVAAQGLAARSTMNDHDRDHALLLATATAESSALAGESKQQALLPAG